MDSIVDMLFLPQLFKYGFEKKPRHTGEGPMDFLLRSSYGTGKYLLKPVGQSLVVGVTDFRYRRPVEMVWKHPKYFHISLWRGTLRGFLADTGQGDAYYQQVPVGFHHSTVGISFLPDFFDIFLGQRHGISRDELEQALAALQRLPPPPHAALILNQIGEESVSGGVGNAWIEAKTLELVSLLLDWHRRLETTTQPHLSEQDREGIAKVLHYAGEHFAEPLSLNTLAKQAAMSISKFTALFKIQAGISAACYIHNIRMEKAMDLLQNTSDSLSEIAVAVGYKHHASFTAAFREQFGMAPAAFRKSKVGNITGAGQI
jgi:AraC-like DNA-binding protein